MQNALGCSVHRPFSPEALTPVFEVAQLIGKERRIDPMLILVDHRHRIALQPVCRKLGWAPRGLMVVIPRFHTDKLPAAPASVRCSIR